MTTVVTILQAVRLRLADPRAWVKYHWSAHRDEYGAVHRVEAGDERRGNCWCLGQAITLAILEQTGPSGGSQTTGTDVVRFTELRSDVERELLATLDSLGVVDRDTGTPFPAVYLWNDTQQTAHHEVLRVIDSTNARLAEAA